jgi:putative transposase
VKTRERGEQRERDFIRVEARTPARCGLPHPCRTRSARQDGSTILPINMQKPKRFQHQRCLHFITFSCYHRMQLLGSTAARDAFEHELERIRTWYGCFIAGYVVMPEHVHLLVTEPERGELAVAIQMLKQITSRRLRPANLQRFWQVRYYDFPVWSEKKRIEKLRYIHRNPVKRGLAARPADWEWSSFRQWATGYEGTVEIESQWTARRRELMGIPLGFVDAHPSPKNRRKGGATPTS